MKRYAVKEVYFTLQGEGVHTGRPAVFLRFAGCNLWDGLESSRADAVCRFCDTDFRGTNGPRGGKYAADELGDLVTSVWEESAVGNSSSGRFVVCTGGEPFLQLDDALVEVLHDRGFFVAAETNGTVSGPATLDWVCVSPKAGSALAVKKGDELKLVYPQEAAPPEAFLSLEFDYFSLQPMDGPSIRENTRKATEYCLKNPLWRLSLQTHKILGIP